MCAKLQVLMTLHKSQNDATFVLLFWMLFGFHFSPLTLTVKATQS